MAPKPKKIPNKPAAQKPLDQAPPNWPVFKPLLPTSDLSLTEVADSQIVVIKELLDFDPVQELCIVSADPALDYHPRKPKKGDAVRVNDRFQIDDGRFANRLWVETGLRELICGGESAGEDLENGMSQKKREDLWGGKVIGLNPNIRVYRYTKGQFFDQHYDESNLVTITNNSLTTPAKTTWTILLYLTSAVAGCEGGETVFYPEDNSAPIVVSLDTGMLLLHKHGKDCMLHEGREVLEGEKWVIRTDLCVMR